MPAIKPVQYQDPLTGRSITRWTDGPWKDQHLYFTGPSITADGRWIIVISERDGHPKLYGIDRRASEIHCLTPQSQGKLLSYCHGDGGPKGLSKSFPCLDGQRGRVYGVVDDQVLRLDLEPRQSRVLGTIPAGWVTSFSHVSADGRWLCVPLCNPESFTGDAAVRDQATQMKAVWKRVIAGQVRSKILLFDTQTGDQRCAAEVPFWVTHVQFDPSDPGRILFNSESLWHEQDHIPRMWILEADGKTHPLFDQAKGERVGHENWSPDGRSIVYHGFEASDDFYAANKGHHFLARRDLQGNLLERMEIGALGIHHATLLANGDYLVDTLDGIVGVVHPEGSASVVRPLCRSDTRDRSDQDTHAHAKASPDGREVVWSSDKDGGVNVYCMTLDEA